jgi:hypothetical protein
MALPSSPTIHSSPFLMIPELSIAFIKRWDERDGKERPFRVLVRQVPSPTNPAIRSNRDNARDGTSTLVTDTALSQRSLMKTNPPDSLNDADASFQSTLESSTTLSTHLSFL